MAIARATSIARLMSFCTISRLLGEMATNPLLFSEAIWLPAIPTYAVVIFFPERRSARSRAAAMEVTVSSMFTTTPRRKPCEGQVPTPTIFSFPSRSSSPTRTQIFVVPTSILTITRSCTIHAPHWAVEFFQGDCTLQGDYTDSSCRENASTLALQILNSLMYKQDEIRSADQPLPG